jgi:hypothetical protein
MTVQPDTDPTPPWDEWVAELFADAYCDECLGDVEDHEPWVVLGNWFAHCKQTLAPGVIVETQHGPPEHRGTVLAERHPLQDWLWVQWEHIGRHDEHILDITIIGRPDASAT